jgi:hypothetical protein
LRTGPGRRPIALMARASKRPCSICRRWFQPDARVGSRQYACSEPECQQRRRRGKQAEWRRRNPDYFVARRWTAATEGESSVPPRTPAPLEEVPWDVVQSQMGSKAGVVLGLFARVLLVHVQSQLRAQVPVITGESGRLPPQRVQSQMEAQQRERQAGAP